MLNVFLDKNVAQVFVSGHIELIALVASSGEEGATCGTVVVLYPMASTPFLFGFIKSYQQGGIETTGRHTRRDWNNVCYNETSIQQHKTERHAQHKP